MHNMSSKFIGLTVTRDMNEARPASDVSSPIASMKYARLNQKPNSIPALRVCTSSRARNTKGKNGIADMMNRTAEKAAGSMVASASLTTIMSLAAGSNQTKRMSL